MLFGLQHRSDVKVWLKMKIGLRSKHLMSGSSVIKQLHKQHYQLHLLLTRLTLFLSCVEKFLLRLTKVKC